MSPSLLTQARQLWLLLALLTVSLSGLRATDADLYSYRPVVMGGGGFVSGLVFHPTEKDLLYARTDVGGAYRWNAANKSWIALNDDITQADSQLLGVLSIALDRNNPDALYLACGQYLAWWAHPGAILISQDRGATWTRSNLGIKLGGNADGRGAGERLQVDPNKGSILFLGSSQDGLWRSDDAAKTWTKVTGFSQTAVTFVAFDPRTGTAGNATQTLYAGVDTSSGFALWRSTDGGSTWAALPGQPTGLRAYRGVVDTAGTFYCTFSDAIGPNGASKGAVWKFQPEGNVWTNITPSTGQGGYAGLSVDASRPGTLLVSTLDRWAPGDEIYRSTDGGATWKGVLYGTTRKYDSASYAAASTPHWIGDVQINPRDPDNALFVTGYGLYATYNATVSDTGSTQPLWEFSCRDLEETVPLALVSPTAGASLVSAVGDIDGFRHVDTSVSPSWGRLSPRIGTNTYIQYAATDSAVMVRTGSNQALYSTDGAVSWTAFPSRPSFATDAAGKVTVSADGRRFLWTPAGAGAYWSADKGVTWTASAGLPAAGSNTYAPIADQGDGQVFYVFNQSSGTLYRSSDGGLNFAAAATGLPAASGKLKAATGVPGELWLAIWGRGLYRSTDSGSTFQKLSTAADAYNVGFGKAAPGKSAPAVFLWGKVGTAEGYFRSDDSGATWARINDSHTQFGWCNDLTGDPRVYGRLYIATGGRGVIQGDLANPPRFSSQPVSQNAAPGSRLVLEALAGGASSYQWYRDGKALAGATSATLTLMPFRQEDTGLYVLQASNASGTTASEGASIGTAPAIPDKLSNISTLANVSEVSVMTAGFVISGTQSKTVLIRASGPALRDLFNFTNALSDPTLTLFRGQTQIAYNDDWDASIAPTAAAVGAFGWTAGSKDAALLITLAPGIYSAQIKGKGVEGVSIVEVYDADPAPSASWISNISTLSAVTPQQPQVVGFAVSGSKARRLLIRSSGPALIPFNVPAPLKDPQFTLHDQPGAELAKAQDWSATPEMLLAFDKTGAFGWTAGSKDAALLTTLSPGTYSARITNTLPDPGNALVEVYDYP